jgi:membrane fusion protein, multidrug efflux system
METRIAGRIPAGRRAALALTLAAGGLLALSACGGDGDGVSQAVARPGGPPGAGGFPGGVAARATPISANVVEAGDLEVTLRSSTNLRAREEVDVIPRQAGVISRILVEEGARVSQGQVLAQLDDAEWRLQADQSEARAQAARDAVERARALRELDLISEQEVERLASEARVSEAEVGLARLRVENAQIRAPIAGTVTHRYIERGQQVGTANPSFRLADLDRLEAQLAIPERESSRVVVGQTARILLQEGAAPVATGRVERIRPVVDAGSGTVQVTVTVASQGGEVPLRPGQFVNVDVVTETLPDRITLPRTSVLVDGAAPRVFVVREGIAVEREVTLGFSRGDRVEIRSGIEPGDTVVVRGQDNLRPDAPVRMMELDGRAVAAPAAATPGAQAPGSGGVEGDAVTPSGRPEGMPAGARPQGGPGGQRPDGASREGRPANPGGDGAPAADAPQASTQDGALR